MKSSNFSSYDKINTKVTGNFITATSLDGRAISISHKATYNCLWINYEDDRQSIIRITLANNSTIEIPFLTTFKAHFHRLGTYDGIGLLYRTNNIILPIQHTNIELIQNPTYGFYGGIVPLGLCPVFSDANVGTAEYCVTAYTGPDGSGDEAFYIEGMVSDRDPEDCDSAGVTDIQDNFLGYYADFSSGTCP